MYGGVVKERLEVLDTNGKSDPKTSKHGILSVDLSQDRTLVKVYYRTLITREVLSTNTSRK